MNEDPFRRPSQGACFIYVKPPGVSLRSTPGFNPAHPLGALERRATIRDSRGFPCRQTSFLQEGGVSLLHLPPRGIKSFRQLDTTAPTNACLAPEARRNTARSAAQRNSGKPIQKMPSPWQGATESRIASKVTFVKRQPMRLQQNFELFEKRHASMVFFLVLDVSAHLRHLRFTHRERTITFLPRESCDLPKRSRNPTGGVRFQLADQLRDCLVLPQLRQDVDMVRRSVDDQRDSVFIADRSAEVLMNARPDLGGQPWFAALRRENDVIEQIAVGGTHTGGPFRRPCSGAALFVDHTPGVSLRSTPPCSFAALHCRLYSAAPSALFSIRPDAPCRRRAGLKPRVKRSGTRGSHIDISKPLARGDGIRVS